MYVPVLLSIFAAVCIIPTLFAGAVSDIAERKFPAVFWEWSIKIAGVIVFLEYLVLVSDGNWQRIAMYLAISAVVSGICFFIGFRYGSGGDWRALAYIALISPWLLLEAGVLILITGFCIAIPVLLNKNDKTPVLFRTVPFAVAIFVGYTMAVIWAMVANL